MSSLSLRIKKTHPIMLFNAKKDADSHTGSLTQAAWVKTRNPNR